MIHQYKSGGWRKPQGHGYEQWAVTSREDLAWRGADDGGVLRGGQPEILDVGLFRLFFLIFLCLVCLRFYVRGRSRCGRDLTLDLTVLFV